MSDNYDSTLENYAGESAFIKDFRNGIRRVQFNDFHPENQQVIEISGDILKKLNIKDENKRGRNCVTIEHKNGNETHSLSFSDYNVKLYHDEATPTQKETYYIVLPEYPLQRAHASENIKDSKGNMQEYQYVPNPNALALNIDKLLSNITSYNFIENLPKGYEFGFEPELKDKLISGKDKMGRDCVTLAGTDFVINGKLRDNGDFLAVESSNMQSDSRFFDGKMNNIVSGWRFKTRKEIANEKKIIKNQDMESFKFEKPGSKKLKEANNKLKQQMKENDREANRGNTLGK